MVIMSTGKPITKATISGSWYSKGRFPRVFPMKPTMLSIKLSISTSSRAVVPIPSLPERAGRRRGGRALPVSRRVDEVSVQLLHLGQRIELQLAAVAGRNGQTEFVLDRFGRNVGNLVPAHHLAPPAALPNDTAL